jgi:glycosyltransferase involved in cell wall biosynthesis
MSLLNHSDYVLPNSEYGVRLLRKMGIDEKKLKLIPNGVDINEFSIKKSSIKVSESITVCTVARLVPWKGIDDLLHAAKLVLSKRSDVKFVIIGDGPDKKTLQRLTKTLGIEEFVYFTGRQSREKVIKYLASADIFVLPSHFDSTPNALLEAMVSGKAVIVSDFPGNAEVVENNFDGLVFKTGDVNELVEKLLELISDKKLRDKLGKNAREKIKRKYSWDLMVERLVKLYEKVMN